MPLPRKEKKSFLSYLEIAWNSVKKIKGTSVNKDLACKKDVTRSGFILVKEC